MRKKQQVCIFPPIEDPAHSGRPHRPVRVYVHIPLLRNVLRKLIVTLQILVLVVVIHSIYRGNGLISLEKPPAALILLLVTPGTGAVICPPLL